MTRRGRRTALAVLASAVALVVGAAYAGAAALRVPPPHDLVRLQAHEPSEQGGDFAARPVVSSGPARPLEAAADAGLPATVPWKGGRITPQEMLDETHTRAFVVLHDGRLVHEWYAEGVDAGTRLSSWSVAKSVVSLLAGRAIGAGKLREQDRLVDLLPELTTGTAYDTITIQDLLDMTSGVDVAENYSYAATSSDDTTAMYLTDDIAAFVRDHRDLKFPPGSRADYRSIDAQLLGMAVARAEGKSLGELLQHGIWEPIGAQDDAVWNLDRQGGQEKGFCCLNATARDFAKIGQLILDNGRSGDTQVVPARWIGRIEQPAPLRIGPWGYSALWWHPTGGSGHDLAARGIFGQYIFVDQDTDTVIVKLSDNQLSSDEQEVIDALRAIAES